MEGSASVWRDAANPQATEIRRDMPLSGHSAVGPTLAELGGKRTSRGEFKWNFANI